MGGIVSKMLPALHKGLIIVAGLSNDICLGSRRSGGKEGLSLIGRMGNGRCFRKGRLVALDSRSLATDAARGEVFCMMGLCTLIGFFREGNCAMSASGSMFFRSSRLTLGMRRHFSYRGLSSETSFGVRFTTT